MDYTVPEEEMSPSFAAKARAMEEIGISKYPYSRKKILNLLSLLEAEIVGVYDMQATEYVLNGSNKLFRERGEGMLELAAFHI